MEPRPSCSHIESKQSSRTWLVQNRESENITAGKHQTKAVAAERFVKELEKNSYQSRFRTSYNACQLKGNNSQTMYLTLLYCEKPMLLNLICWLVKINEFYYSPSFIYIIFSATKLQIDENHGILWENYIVQVK